MSIFNFKNTFFKKNKNIILPNPEILLESEVPKEEALLLGLILSQDTKDLDNAFILLNNKILLNFEKSSNDDPNKKFKPDYSNVTSYVFREKLVRDTIDIQFSVFEDHIKKSDKEIDQKILYYLEKLRNHTNLAIIQQEYIKENISQIREQVKETKIETEAFLEESKAKLGEVQDTKSDLYTDFIAILGVFSALLFGLFVGFDVFKEIISNMASNAKITRSVIMRSLLLMGLNMLIFLLFEGISRLTNKTFKSCCNEDACNHSIGQKYPIFLYGTSILSLVICISVLFMLNNSDGSLYENNLITFILVLLIVSIIVYIVFLSRSKNTK